MSLLVLNEEELALLRFTCDLFFVPESPLVHLDREQREPADYAATYQALVDRGVVDPAGFRITDTALNRLAPVTECDARLVHLAVTRGEVAREDHYLLDEIAVRHEVLGTRHTFGPDVDQQELTETLARRFLPRRALGDHVDVVLSAAELLCLSLLLSAADQADRRALSTAEVKTALGRPPVEDPGLLAPGLLAKRREVNWDAALGALCAKGVAFAESGGVRLAGNVYALRGLSLRPRHTLVRTDFREDDWLMREVSLLPVEGSLFLVAAKRGGFHLCELDGKGLRRALLEATGAFPAAVQPAGAPERTAARDPQPAGPRAAQPASPAAAAPAPTSSPAAAIARPAPVRSVQGAQAASLVGRGQQAPAAPVQSGPVAPVQMGYTRRLADLLRGPKKA
jgi:hypothetical protein